MSRPSLTFRRWLAIGLIAGVSISTHANKPASKEPDSPRNTIEVEGTMYPVYEIRKEAKPTYSPKPRFPRRAKKENRGGTVLIGALVDQQGNVFNTAIAMTNAEEDIQDAAIAAVRKWTFPVQRVDGQAIAYAVMVPIVLDATPHFGPQR